MGSILDPMRGGVAKWPPLPSPPPLKGERGTGSRESSVSLGRCISRGSDLEATQSKDRLGL